MDNKSNEKEILIGMINSHDFQECELYGRFGDFLISK